MKPRPTAAPAPRPAPSSSTAARAAATRRLGSLKDTFRSLRHRNYRLYFIGQLISLLGSWVQTTALMWLAFDLTHQSTWPALITAAQILPTFLLGAWGGMLADQLPKRSLIAATQTAFLVLALLLAGLVYAGVANPWHLLIISALNGIVQAVDLPARLAFVMDLVGREDLMNGVALNSLLFNVARTVGPALAGWLLIGLGAATCFFLNALSFIAVVWALLCMDVVHTARPMEAGRGLHALLEGFHYLRTRPEMSLLILLAGLISLFGWPYLSLLPAYADHTLRAQEWGYSLLLSSTGLGALAAALTLAAFGSLRLRQRFVGIGVALVSLALLGLSLAGSVALAAFWCGLIGYGLILFFATGQSVIQLNAGEHNRGRIMGIWAMILSGAVPLGNLITGPSADLWGEPLVLRWQGLACAVSALAVLGLGLFWAVREEPSGPETTEELIAATVPVVPEVDEVDPI